MTQVEHPVMLIVMDGWGYSEDPRHNAIAAADTPVWDALIAEHPNTLIRCSGGDVGLPAAQMGNSEVGHMHLGAGRTINQDLTRISLAIEKDEFRNNPVFAAAAKRAAANDSAIHVMGLLSPGGVHSHVDHIIALIELAKDHGVRNVHIHGFLDGRDTPPKSATDSIRAVELACAKLGIGSFATIIGRYFAMDRNKNWERTEIAYNAIVNARAPYDASEAQLALENAYSRGETDEFVQATTINGDSAYRGVQSGDVVMFANFRADRARQLTRAFIEPTFTEFDRRSAVSDDSFVTMTNYSAEFAVPVAFPATQLDNTYGEWVSAHGLRQLRIAETEKYAHVTFFFNGGLEKVAEGEDRLLIPSPDVATYDLKPEMSAAEVTDQLVEAILASKYDTIICNYANADMVGHTGNFDAAVTCIEVLDRCLGRVLDAAKPSGMEILITADHGNAEQMRAYDENGVEIDAHTAHTSNLVPLLYIGRPANLADDGCLSDIAPTMLTLLGLKIPPEMSGKPLLTLDSGDQCAA